MTHGKNKGWWVGLTAVCDLPEVASGQVPSLLWSLFCGLVFRRTKPTREVLLPTGSACQSRDWHSWRSCPCDDSSCLTKPTYRVPLRLLKQGTLPRVRETHVRTTTSLLLQIFDFLMSSPQLFNRSTNGSYTVNHPWLMHFSSSTHLSGCFLSPCTLRVDFHSFLFLLLQSSVFMKGL